MRTTIQFVFAALHAAFLGRAALPTEIFALRQQVAILKRERPRPSLRMIDRLFCVILARLWPGWREALVIVKPETVIGWHRKGHRRSQIEMYEDAAIEKNWKMGTIRPCR